MELYLIILLIIGILLILISWLKSELHCVPSIIYKYIPINTIDVAFSESNKPSEIHKEIFTESTPTFGGFTTGIGKTVVPTNLKPK